MCAGQHVTLATKEYEWIKYARSAFAHLLMKVLQQITKYIRNFESNCN
jgi:hypothetical protein